jgi:hypothetical protein
MKRPRDRSPAKSSKRSTAARDADLKLGGVMRLPVVAKPVLRSISHERVQGLFGILTTAGVEGVVSAAVLRVAAAVVLRGNRR